jgi:hypothetical protein
MKPLQAIVLAILLAPAAPQGGTRLHAQPPAQSQPLATQQQAEDIANSRMRVRRTELDEQELIAIRAFKRAERDAVLDGYKLRHRLYERQLYYHPIVLATVIVIVLTGVIFCGFQVWRDIHAHSSAATTFKVSRDGIELSSSVVGLIALCLSFLFFYLYVTTIYHITEGNWSSPAPAQASAAPGGQPGIPQPAPPMK